MYIVSVSVATQTDTARPTCTNDLCNSSTNTDWCSIVCVDASTQTVIVRLHLEDCKNDVNNSTNVLNIITQPASIDCPRKSTFCTINSVSKSLGELLKLKIHVSLNIYLRFVSVLDFISAFSDVDNLMAICLDKFMCEIPH